LLTICCGEPMNETFCPGWLSKQSPSETAHRKEYCRSPISGRKQSYGKSSEDACRPLHSANIAYFRLLCFQGVIQNPQILGRAGDAEKHNVRSHEKQRTDTARTVEKQPGRRILGRFGRLGKPLAFHSGCPRVGVFRSDRLHAGAHPAQRGVGSDISQLS